MKAVLLAGGMGTRLHPLTLRRPKPLVPICLEPILGYVLRWLEKNGVDEVLALLYHQADQIADYLVQYPGQLKIDSVRLTEDWGTAGALKQVEDRLPENFLVVNGDVLTNMNLRPLFDRHQETSATVTIALTKVKNPKEYGVVILRPDGRIWKFLEKPVWSEVFSDTINSGVYVFSRAALAEVPVGPPTDISRHLFPRLLKQDMPIYGVVTTGYWRDVGDLAEYQQVHLDLLENRAGIELLAQPVRGSLIHPEAQVDPAAILERTVVGRGCVIAAGTQVRHSIIGEEVFVGEGALLEKCVIDDRVKIGPRVQCLRGSVVAQDTEIQSDAVIKPYVRIWPDKEIEAGAVVPASVIWKERFSRTIFGAWGVTGICNIEITPEFSAALGSAFGATLGRGKRIVTSRDGHRASRMAYRALISGVLSAGVDVADLEATPIPVTRYELKALSGAGGFHVRRSPYDAQVIDIKFFDDKGLDLTPEKERAIERNFFGEDFQRVALTEVGELSFPAHRLAEQYRDGFLSRLDVPTIANRHFRIVIDYAYGTASNIFPSILGELGCEVVAINAHPDEERTTKTPEEFQRSFEQLSQIVKSLKADLGVMFDAGAEKVFLIDEKGHPLKGEETLLTVLSMHAREYPGTTMAVPVTAPHTADQLAETLSCTIIRTKLRPRAFTEAGLAADATLLAEPTGGFIFPQFLESFDALFSTAKLLEYLARRGTSLGKVRRTIPTTFTMQRTVACPDTHKPRLLRKLSEGKPGARVELLDGVRWVWPSGSVLVLPDPDRPIVQLFAEADTEEESVKIATEAEQGVAEIIQ